MIYKNIKSSRIIYIVFKVGWNLYLVYHRYIIPKTLLSSLMLTLIQGFSFILILWDLTYNCQSYKLSQNELLTYLWYLNLGYTLRGLEVIQKFNNDDNDN